MDDKILKLSEVIFSVKKFPTNLRLFLITEKAYIRIYYGRITPSYFAEEFGIVKNLRLERGEILDLFSKLEFLINELIQLKLLGPNSGNKGLMLDEILENVDFFSRIRLLNRWGLINNKLLNLLMQTKQVRNGFAHAWDKGEIKYKGKLIEVIFSEFKKDMKEIWKQLLKIYKEEQVKIDVDSIIKDIEKINKENGDE